MRAPWVLANLSLRERDYTVHIVPSTGPQEPKLPLPLPWVQLQAQSNKIFRDFIF